MSFSMSDLNEEEYLRGCCWIFGFVAKDLQVWESILTFPSQNNWRQTHNFFQVSCVVGGDRIWCVSQDSWVQNLLFEESRKIQKISSQMSSSFSVPKLPEIENLLQTLDPPRRTRPNLLYLTTIGVKQFYNNLKYPNELPSLPLVDRYKVEKLIG